MDVDNERRWVVLGLGGLVLGTALACKKGSSSSSGGSSTSSPASDEYLTIPNTTVQIKAPTGWNRKQSGEWGMLGSPDKKALLAFVNFDRPGESTAKLGQVAMVLGTSDIKWGSAKSITIGPDAMPAQAADGTCKFPAGDGIISYATVNPGSSTQILIVYAVENAAPAATRQQAIATVGSMRRKR